MNDILKKINFNSEDYQAYSESIKLQLSKHHYWSGKRQVFKKHNFEVTIHRLFINQHFIDVEIVHVHDKWAKHIVHYIQTDPLTGLLQAEYFLKLIKLQLQKNAVKALINIDLDYFKEINDLYGHQFGNKVLILIGKKIQQYINQDGFCCRFGGDEFSILMKSSSKMNLATICQRLLTIMSKPIKIENKTIQISGSIGVAIYPEHGTSSMELLDNADIAMYESKKHNRNTYHIYQEVYRYRIKQRLILYQDLKKALQNNEFELFIQPIINLNTHAIDKAELFIRWNHPTFGFIQPSQFIQQIDNYEILLELDNWVFEHSLKLIKRFKPNPSHFKFFINISGIEFLYNQENIKKWIALIKEKNIPTHQIVLEIKEDIFIGNFKKHMHQLSLLKKYNIQFAIDNFDAVISNLHALQIIKTKYIKISKDFIQKISNPQQKNLLKAIIEMAHILNLKVIAEGIEKEQELQILKELNCDLGQGFLFDKPLDIKAFKEKYLKD